MRAAAVSAKRFRHLVTREGTPGVEVELAHGGDPVSAIRSALDSVHGQADAAAVDRAVELAVAVVTESGVLLGERGRVKLRCWAKRDLVRIELSDRSPAGRWPAADLIATRATRWGFIDGGLVLWFEVGVNDVHGR
jgi:hypothetical protein